MPPDHELKKVLNRVCGYEDTLGGTNNPKYLELIKVRCDPMKIDKSSGGGGSKKQADIYKGVSAPEKFSKVTSTHTLAVAFGRTIAEQDCLARSQTQTP